MNTMLAHNAQIAQAQFFESVGQDWKQFFKPPRAIADVYTHILSLPSAVIAKDRSPEAYANGLKLFMAQALDDPTIAPIGYQFEREAHTLKAYAKGLRAFIQFAGDQLPTPSLMTRYIAALRQSGRSASTIACKYIAPARLYLEKLSDQRPLGLKGDIHTFAYDCQDQMNRAKRVRAPQSDTTNYEAPIMRHGNRVGKSKIQTMLRYITINTANTVLGHRDYFLYVLAFSTGLRLAEIQRLTLANFYEDENEQWWIRVRGKRNNTTPIAIDSHIKFLADTYVDAYNRHAPAPITSTIPLLQPIFKGDHIAPLRVGGMSCNSISAIMGKWSFRAIGIKLAPHDFRRSFATNALKEGWDIVDISIAMRHGLLQTTAHYLGKLRGEKPKTMRLV